MFFAKLKNHHLFMSHYNIQSAQSPHMMKIPWKCGMSAEINMMQSLKGTVGNITYQCKTLLLELSISVWKYYLVLFCTKFAIALVYVQLCRGKTVIQCMHYFRMYSMWWVWLKQKILLLYLSFHFACWDPQIEWRIICKQLQLQLYLC